MVMRRKSFSLHTEALLGRDLWCSPTQVGQAANLLLLELRDFLLSFRNLVLLGKGV